MTRCLPSDLKEKDKMNAIVKREQLWRDRQSIEELQKSNLFQALHELYLNIVMHEPPLFPMEEVLVLNEVGYSVVWLQYQSTKKKHVDMEQMLRNAYATMGMKYYAHIVVCLTWAAVKLVQFPAIYISKEACKELKLMAGQCWCGGYIKKDVERLCREGVYYMESFVDGVTWEPIDAPKTYNLSGEDIRGLTADEVFIEKKDVEHVPVKNRTFTLDQIVEEAKKMFPLEHSFTLVFMLHSLMQNDSTAEERALVDGIVEHIRQNAKGGMNIGNLIIKKHDKTYIKEQTVIPNVGNYKPKIQSQTMNMPFPPMEQDEQELLAYE